MPGRHGDVPARRVGLPPGSPVDPRVIPLGSRVYVPAYRADGHGGWFIAADTGGAINGHHIDVYRPPAASSPDPGQFFGAQRIYVIKPHH